MTILPTKFIDGLSLGFTIIPQICAVCIVFPEFCGAIHVYIGGIVNPRFGPHLDGGSGWQSEFTRYIEFVPAFALQEPTFQFNGRRAQVFDADNLI